MGAEEHNIFDIEIKSHAWRRGPAWHGIAIWEMLCRLEPTWALENMAFFIYRLKAMLGGEALHGMGLLFGKCYVGRSWLGYWGA